MLMQQHFPYWDEHMNVSRCKAVLGLWEGIMEVIFLTIVCEYA